MDLCAAEHIISLSNLMNDMTVHHPVILLSGSVTNATPCLGKLRIYHSSKVCTDTESEWEVVNCRYKALVHLKEGQNELTLKYCSTEEFFFFKFQARTSKKVVTPIVIVCNGHDGRIDVPEGMDNSLELTCKKLKLGVNLIQTFYAQELYENGLGQQTFQVESDSNNEPVCYVHQSHLHVNCARSMTQDELWEHFAKELMMSSLGNVDRKFLALLSFSRMQQHNTLQPKTEMFNKHLDKAEAVVAIGTGGLALLGTPFFFTWPSAPTEVIARFKDRTPVYGLSSIAPWDEVSTLGDCLASTLGAACHELGHLFDLGHAAGGIMGQNYHSMNFVFTTGTGFHNIIVPASNREPSGTVPFKPSITNIRRAKPIKKHMVFPYLELSSAVLLKYHKWFNEFDIMISQCQEECLSIVYDSKKGLVTAAAGIRVIEIRDPRKNEEVCNSFQFIKKATKSFRLAFHINNIDLSKQWTLVVTDNVGNLLKLVTVLYDNAE